jgi:hypothetical protein
MVGKREQTGDQARAANQQSRRAPAQIPAAFIVFSTPFIHG